MYIRRGDRPSIRPWGTPAGLHDKVGPFRITLWNLSGFQEGYKALLRYPIDLILSLLSTLCQMLLIYLKRRIYSQEEV